MSLAISMFLGVVRYVRCTLRCSLLNYLMTRPNLNSDVQNGKSRTRKLVFIWSIRDASTYLSTVKKSS